MSVEKYQRIFKLYKKVTEIQENAIAQRGRRGIAVHTDFWSKKWQDVEMRREIMEAFLEDRNPNWAHARYLSLEERKKRNTWYKRINGLTLFETIKKERKKHSPKQWGTTYDEYIPELYPHKFGDGLQLIWFWTTNDRPYHWLLLIDSKVNIEDDDFDYEVYLSSLEDEYGQCYPSCESCNGEGECGYPAIDFSSGGGWGSIANFG